MKYLLILVCMIGAVGVKAQKVESIFFNLYTDSLKRGVHNYINVDGKLADGRFFPLTSKEVTLSSCAGRWEGNSLILDSAYTKDSVVISAVLKERPDIKKTITIYLKKNTDEGVLRSEQELLESWRKEGKKKKKNE